MKKRSEQEPLKKWCTNEHRNGLILYNALKSFGYEYPSQLKSSSNADLRELENDISKEYNIKASFRKLKRNNYVSYETKYSQHKQQLDISDQIYSNLVLEANENPLQVLHKSKTKHISTTKPKINNCKLFRIKKHFYILFIQEEKQIRVQFIEGTKSIYILKRIFYKLGLNYDDIIAAKHMIQFTNKVGQNIEINDRIKNNCKIYLKIIKNDGDSGNSYGGGDAGDGENNTEDDEEELKFKLPSTLTKWNSKNCIGFKVFHGDRYCKCIYDFENDNCDTKHIIISKSGIKYNKLIYKWTIMFKELKHVDLIKFGIGLVFKDEIRFDEENRLKCIKPSLKNAFGRLMLKKSNKNKMSKIEIIIDLTNKNIKGKGIYYLFNDECVLFSPFSSRKLPKRSIASNELFLFVACKNKLLPYIVYNKSIELLNINDNNLNDLSPNNIIDHIKTEQDNLERFEKIFYDIAKDKYSLLVNFMININQHRNNVIIFISHLLVKYMHYYGYLDEEYINNKSIKELKLYALQLINENEKKYEEALIKNIIDILIIVYIQLIKNEKEFTIFFKQEIQFFDLNVNWIKYLIKINKYIFDKIIEFMNSKHTNCEYINYINLLIKSSNINLFEILLQFIQNENSNQSNNDILMLHKLLDEIKNYKQIGIKTICDEMAQIVISSNTIISIYKKEHKDKALQFISYLIRKYLTFFGHLKEKDIKTFDCHQINQHLTSIINKQNLIKNISAFIDALIYLHQVTNNNLSSLFVNGIKELKSLKKFDKSLSYILGDTLTKIDKILDKISSDSIALFLKQSTQDSFNKSLNILKDIFKQKCIKPLKNQMRSLHEQLKPILLKKKVIGDCIRINIVCNLFTPISHNILFSTIESDVINPEKINNVQQKHFENDIHYDISDLEEQKTYYFKVKSQVGKDAFTIYSNIVTIKTNKSLIPSFTTVPYYNTMKLELTMETNETIKCNAVEYKQISLDEKTDDDEKYEIKEQIEYQEFNDNIILIKNLKPNIKYTLRVRTKFDEQDWFKYSNYKYFTTSDDKDYLRVIDFKKYNNLIKSSNKCYANWFDDTDEFDRAEIGCPGKHVLSSFGMYKTIKRQLIETNNKIVSVTCDICNTHPSLNWDTCTQIANMTEQENLKFSTIIKQRKEGIYQLCPHCKGKCERKLIKQLNSKDKRNQVLAWKIKCNNCSKPEWCWNCAREWKLNDSTYQCGNDDCKFVTEINELLANCEMCKSGEAPEMRACPTCLSLITRIAGCKHMTCTTCTSEFCFICLKFWNKGCSHSNQCVFTPKQSFK